MTTPTPSAWPKKPLGATGLMVPALCIGTSELGGSSNNFPDPPDEERALARVRAVLDGPITFFDTAAGYGESERRIGVVLRERGGLPEGFVLATKVDRDKETNQCTGARARVSVERSLARLGLERLQLVYLHNPEFMTFERCMAPDGPIAALRKCRDEGLIDYVGVAGGPVDMMMRFAETGAVEAVLSHNRYTLVNVAAEPLWQLLAQRGVAAVNGAAYGGGILSRGVTEHPKYAYKPASPEVVARVRKLEALCARYQVPLPAAALQFSLRNPLITATVVGTGRPERLAETLALATFAIPAAFWADIRVIGQDHTDFES